MYSNRPAASLVVTELVAKNGSGKPEGRRKLNAAGMQAVDDAAAEISARVDDLLEKAWNRRAGKFSEQGPEAAVATCSCSSGIPIQKVILGGREVELVALPLIFQNFLEEKKAPSSAVLDNLLEMVKIYNQIAPGEEAEIRQAVAREYAAYYHSQETKA